MMKHIAITPRITSAWVICLWALLVATAAAKAELDAPKPATPTPGQTDLPIEDQILNHYRQIQTYQATADFSMKVTTGKRTQTFDGQRRILFDRKSQRLLIDTPDIQMAIGDTKVRFVIKQAEDSYVKTHLKQPLTYSQITDLCPPFRQDKFPALALLIGEHPFDLLSSSLTRSVKAIGPDKKHDLPGIMIRSSAPNVTLRYDPETLLIQSLSFAGKAGRKRRMVMNITFRDILVNEPIDADPFKMDVHGKQAYPSLQALAQAYRQKQSQGKLAIGQMAPDFSLPHLGGGKPVRLSELVKNKDIIILDFWATWCGPCRRAMPKLDQLYRWAKSKNLSVAVCPINVGEDLKTVTRYWDKQNFALTSLLDQNKQVARLYGIEAFPTTLVLHKGKIIDTHQGYHPSIIKKMKKQIKTLLIEKS